MNPELEAHKSKARKGENWLLAGACLVVAAVAFALFRGWIGPLLPGGGM